LVSDLYEIYESFVKDMLALYNLEDESLLDDRYFTVPLSNGMQFNLIKNGGNIPVTKDRVKEYVFLAINKRLNESKPQIEAFLSGLATIIPIEYLSLFTAEELQRLICGKPTVDIAYLKKHTIYDADIAKKRQLIDNFWDVLDNDLTQEELIDFLRFTMSRTRIFVCVVNHF